MADADRSTDADPSTDFSGGVVARWPPSSMHSSRSPATAAGAHDSDLLAGIE